MCINKSKIESMVEDMKMCSKRNIYICCWFACILLILSFGKIQVSPIVTYNIYYNNQVWYGGIEIVEGRNERLDVDGREVFLEWQDTSKLEPIGIVSERVKDNTIPENEFAINCFAEVGSPVYKILIDGEEWLFVEYELKQETQAYQITVRYQHYFRVLVK